MSHLVNGGPHGCRQKVFQWKAFHGHHHRQTDVPMPLWPAVGSRWWCHVVDMRVSRVPWPHQMSSVKGGWVTYCCVASLAVCKAFWMEIIKWRLLLQKSLSYVKITFSRSRRPPSGTWRMPDVLSLPLLLVCEWSMPCLCGVRVLLVTNVSNAFTMEGLSPYSRCNRLYMVYCLPCIPGVCQGSFTDSLAAWPCYVLMRCALLSSLAPLIMWRIQLYSFECNCLYY